MACLHLQLHAVADQQWAVGCVIETVYRINFTVTGVSLRLASPPTARQLTLPIDLNHRQTRHTTQGGAGRADEDRAPRKQHVMCHRRKWECRVNAAYG